MDSARHLEDFPDSYDFSGILVGGIGRDGIDVYWLCRGAAFRPPFRYEQPQVRRQSFKLRRQDLQRIKKVPQRLHPLCPSRPKLVLMQVLLADLVHEGLATAQRESVRAGDRMIKTAHIAITEAGQRALDG